MITGIAVPANNRLQRPAMDNGGCHLRTSGCSAVSRVYWGRSPLV
jgi:hypothetical protein